MAMDEPPSSRPAEHGASEPGLTEAAPAAEPTEATLGQSPAGRDANQALRALAHTARSFILYDARNERIRGFLEDVREKFEHFLVTHGEMGLDIGPCEVSLAGEVVYSDKDRERSLAFRLYRDGLRRLLIRPGLEWRELIVLIGILSQRYKGFRTLEDDIVTLLWRADFAHIEVAAVEGLVASEEDGSEMRVPEGALAGPRNAMQAKIFNAPYRFDYRWPSYSERAAVQYRPIPPSLLARIADEDGTDTVPHECLLLVKELMAGLSDPHEPLTVGDVAPVLRELAGFLAGERFSDALVEMLRSVQQLGPADERSRTALMAACADEGAVQKLVLAVPDEQGHTPPVLLELLSLAPGDHLSSLLQLFEGSPKHRASPVVRQLLAAQLKGQATRVAERVAALEGPIAVELFRVLAKVEPQGATEAAVGLLGRDQEELQLEALGFLERATYGAKVGRALVGVLAAASPMVRSRALALLVAHREGRAFDPVVERITRTTGADLTLAEATEAGRALARLDPPRARRLFKEWVRPPGLLARLTPGQTTLRWAAVGGLALLPGDESEKLLEWLAHHTSGELAQACATALTQLKQPVGGRPHA
jgi:hypothetical protein